MNSCDSCANDHTPALTESIKELTQELRECRKVYVESGRCQTDQNQENTAPTESRNVAEQGTPVKKETMFAEANELTPDGRYTLPDTWYAQPEVSSRAPLADLGPISGNVHKTSKRKHDRSTARKSTGGRKQDGRKELNTRYNSKRDEMATDQYKDPKLTVMRTAYDDFPDPVCENTPMSLALEGFSSANDVIEAADRIRRRTNPNYRSVVENARKEKKHKKNTGCPSCRLHAYEASEGKTNAREIYDEIVAKCTHEPFDNKKRPRDVKGENAFEDDPQGPTW